MFNWNKVFVCVLLDSVRLTVCRVTTVLVVVSDPRELFYLYIYIKLTEMTDWTYD